MRIIILGAGGVGFHLAKTLTQENHDIIIIDKDAQQIAKVTEQLDVMGIQGLGTGISILKEAGIENADMLLAVTSIDEVNLLACMIAQKFGVATRIARVRNDEYYGEQAVLSGAEMGVDLMINPEWEAAREIVHIVRYPNVFDMVEFENGRIVLLGVLIDGDSPVVGQTLANLVPHHQDLTFRAVAISRQGKTIIPSGKEVVMEGDKFYLAVKQELVEEVIHLAVKRTQQNLNVMILGGGKIGRLTAAMLVEQKHISVKIIESNPDKSRRIAEENSNVMVVCGDGTDLDLLAQEGISEMDMFLALTDDDENNIVSSLLARHLKVGRTMTLISRTDYMPIVKTIGLDVAVNPRFITSAAILKFIRRGTILSLNTLRGIDAETIEFAVTSRCELAGRKLKDIEFPPGVIVGAIIHNDEVIVPIGDSAIADGDRVIVFSVPESVKKVEKMF